MELDVVFDNTEDRFRSEIDTKGLVNKVKNKNTVCQPDCDVTIFRYDLVAVGEVQIPGEVTPIDQCFMKGYII